MSFNLQMFVRSAGLMRRCDWLGVDVGVACRWWSGERCRSVLQLQIIRITACLCLLKVLTVMLLLSLHHRGSRFSSGFLSSAAPCWSDWTWAALWLHHAPWWTHSSSTTCQEEVLIQILLKSAAAGVTSCLIPAQTQEVHRTGSSHTNQSPQNWNPFRTLQNQNQWTN